MTLPSQKGTLDMDLGCSFRMLSLFVSGHQGIYLFMVSQSSVTDMQNGPRDPFFISRHQSTRLLNFSELKALKALKPVLFSVR